MIRSYHHTHFAYEDTEVQSQELHTTYLDLETLSFLVLVPCCLYPHGQLWHLVMLLGTRSTATRHNPYSLLGVQ